MAEVRPGETAARPLPIRDAATVILVRDGAEDPKVLMGMRGATAAFMPKKFVFPGGALDPGDWEIPLARPLPAETAARLAEHAPPGIGPALAVAAVRELWEEAGLMLGRRGEWTGPVAEDWTGFAATGHLPDAGALRFIFRAVTPAGRPRRFDARFFMAEAEALASDPDDFARACDELSLLQWIPLREVRGFDLPFVTELALAELSRLLAEGQPEGVPFFDNTGPRSVFRRIV